jgi:hypothetical protein
MVSLTKKEAVMIWSYVKKAYINEAYLYEKATSPSEKRERRNKAEMWRELLSRLDEETGFSGRTPPIGKTYFEIEYKNKLIGIAADKKAVSDILSSYLSEHDIDPADIDISEFERGDMVSYFDAEEIS